MHIGRVAVRTTVGTYFAAHGAQKLFGWFDGPGPEGTAAMFESVGIRPAKLNATLAGVTEAGAGIALALGVGTPVAATGLIATMVTAIRKVHLPSGPFVEKHGYEYNFVLIGVLLTLIEEGPGFPAFDEGGRGRTGAVIALATAVAGSFFVEAVGNRLAGPAPVAQESPDVSSPAGTAAPA